MIDLIGDVHGYADELEKLLTKLGYSKKDNYYSHPERKVLFVGIILIGDYKFEKL